MHTGTPKLLIRRPTPDEEYERVVFYLQNLFWYEKNGYDLILPQHPLFLRLTHSGANLDILGSEATRKLFAKEVYDANSYADGLEELENDRSVIELAFTKFQNLQQQWGFKVCPKYEIVLTRYGTPGSYDYKLGKIIVSTQSTWSLRQTVIHEAVHIGIEEIVVQPHRLKHWEKERLVDLLCIRIAKRLLPGYTLQPQGDKRIDPFVSEAALKDLPKSISAYVEKYPR